MLHQVCNYIQYVPPKSFPLDTVLISPFSCFPSVARIDALSTPLDFITGTIDSMKRTAFPQLATMMVREMSAPTTDSSSARYDFADLKDPDQPVASDSTIANRVRAHIFTAKILIRYIVMPLLVRGVAHTAPALAFHLAETELKIIEHGHHFF